MSETEVTALWSLSGGCTRPPAEPRVREDCPNSCQSQACELERCWIPQVFDRSDVLSPIPRGTGRGNLTMATKTGDFPAEQAEAARLRQLASNQLLKLAQTAAVHKDWNRTRELLDDAIALLDAASAIAS